MANLQLVGAVGVRVRPDTDGFRNEAKREILSQLKDIEGDVAVNVTPNVQYQEAEALKAFNRAFKDIEVDQNVTVRSKVDFGNLDDIIREKVESISDFATETRIEIDTEAAEKNLSDLTRQVDDIRTGLSRWPTQLEIDKEAYSKAFSNLEQSTLKAQDAIESYELELTKLNESIERTGVISMMSANEQQDAMERMRQAIQEQVDAETEIERLRVEYRLASGKAAKDAVREERLRAEATVAAAKETAAAIKAEIRSIEQRATAAEKERSRSETAIQKINQRLTTQREIIRSNNELLADQRAGYDTDITALEQKIQLEEQRLSSLEEQLEMETALQNARSRSNEELQQTITDLPVHEWDRYIDAVENGLTVSKDYFDWLKIRNKELTQEQIAAIDEVAARRAEAYDAAMEMAEAEAQIRSDFKIDEMQAIFRPELDGRAAAGIEAKLEELARARVVKLEADELRARRIGVELYVSNARDFAADVTRAMSGLRLAEDMSRSIRNTARDMDVLSIAAAKMATTIGSIAAVGGSSLGFVSSLTSDLGELSGALLMAPSLLSTLAASIFAVMKGFEGFGAAMDGDAAALERLGTIGAAAAREMGQLRGALDATMQPAFWRGASNSIRDMAEALQGPLVSGLEATSVAMGEMLAGVARSITTFANSGDMARAFEDMNQGLRNAAEGTEPLFDAINRIGLAGSRHLPALGQAAADAAQRFEDWAVAADNAGKLDQWILQAGEHLQSLGSVVASTTTIVAALGNAAEAAGIGGLANMADALRGVADAAQGEFFQGNMTTIFEGMLTATERLGSGFANLGTAILEQSGFIKSALEDIGTVGENALNALADAFDNPRFLRGGTEFFDDLAAASERLGPVIDMLASGLGDFAAVAGEVVKGALTIAESFLHVLDSSENFSASLEKLIPVLTNITAAAVELAHGPMSVLLDVVAGLIDVFVGLPGPIQTAAVAMALLAVNAGKIRGVAQYVGDLGRAFAGANLAGNLSNMNQGLDGFATTADRSASRVHTAFSRMGDGARRASSAMGVLKSAGAGLFGLMGGAWGVALAAAATALLTFAQNSAETRAEVDALKGTFDELGSTTSATVSTMADSFNDVTAGFGDNLLIWGTSVGDVLRELGTTSGDVANQMINDRGAYDEYADALRAVAQAPTPENIARFAEVTGMSTDKIREMGPELMFLSGELDKAAGRADSAQSSFTNLNGATAPASESAQRLGEAFAVLGDEASSSSDKVSALMDAIDELNGGQKSAIEASIAHHEAIREGGEAAAQAVAQYGDLSKGLHDLGDGLELNTATEEAAALSDALGGLIQPAMEAAVALSEQGASAAEIAGPLEEAKAAWMSMAEQMGLLPAEAQAVWDQMVGMSPEEIVTTLKVEGGAAIEEASALANTLGVEFDNREFVAWLNADPANAQMAAEDATAAAEAFINQEYLADLGVDVATFDAAMAEAESRGQQWDSEEFQAWLTADGTEAEIAGKSAQEIARMFADDTYGAKLTADGTQASAEIEAINANLQSLKDPFLITGTLTADDSQFQAVMIAAEAKGAAITNPAAFRAFVTANAEQFHAESATVDHILNAWATLPHEVRVGAETGDAQLKLDNVRQAMDTVSGTPATATVAEQGADMVSSKVDTVSVRLGTIDGKVATATITATDSASSIITVPLAAAEAFAKQYSGTITATDSASAIIQVPKAQAEQFAKNYAATITATDVATGQITVPKALADSYVKDYQAVITASDGASATIQVPAIMATEFAKSYNATMSAVDGASAVITVPKALAEQYVKDYNATMVASDGASGTIAIPQGQADQFVKDYNANLTASDGATAPITTVQGVADALVKDYNANLTASDAASAPIASIQSVADALVGDYNANMTASDAASGTIGGVQGAANDIVGNYNAHITASDGASGVLSGIVGWLDNIRSGATAIINSITNADGNLIDAQGRVLEFADGGLMAALTRFEKFADGGFASSTRKLLNARTSRVAENHIAQIARPTTPFRIWAEPETGGESYIPLASAKRARSTRIWEETGNRLGVNIEQYAAGGIKAGKINGNPSAPGAGGGGREGVNIHVVNHYPQAEATSVTTNRTLQFAANLLG